MQPGKLRRGRNREEGISRAGTLAKDLVSSPEVLYRRYEGAGSGDAKLSCLHHIPKNVFGRRGYSAI